MFSSRWHQFTHEGLAICLFVRIIGLGRDKFFLDVGIQFWLRGVTNFCLDLSRDLSLLHEYNITFKPSRFIGTYEERMVCFCLLFHLLLIFADLEMVLELISKKARPLPPAGLERCAPIFGLHILKFLCTLHFRKVCMKHCFSTINRPHCSCRWRILSTSAILAAFLDTSSYS